MIKRPSKFDTDTDTDLVAADWAVRRGEGLDAAERAEFDRWLGAEPGHWRAFKASDRVWNDLAGMDLRAIESGTAAAPARRSRLPVWAAVAATIIAAVIGVQVLSPQPTRYESGRGEVRAVRLADGSIVTLGADSAISVRFDDTGRHVQLRRGEAMFDIAHNPNYAFDVRAADTRVTVLGTRFTVKAAPEAVRVDVIQGVVRVSKAESPLLAPFIASSPARKITRGERLESRKGEPPQALPTIDPEKAAPWVSGRLVYENASLAEVVADLNRYSATGVELGTKELGDLRVTAALNQDQVGQFLSSLPATLPVRIERTDAGKVLIEPAG